MFDTLLAYPRELLVFCPWPDRVNGRFDSGAIDVDVTAWYRSHRPSDSVRDMAALRAGDLTCRLFPDAVNRDDLVAAARHIMFGTYYDDHVTSPSVPADHLRECLRAAVQMLDPARATRESPLPCPYLDVMQDMAVHWKALLSEAQWSRFSASWMSYLDSQDPQLEIDTVDAYLAWRHLDEGSGVFMALLPVLNNWPPDDNIWGDPRVAALRQGAGLVTGFDNDLVSPGAEDKRAQIPDLLAVERGLGIEEAARATVALRDLLTCRMERLSSRLTQETAASGETPGGWLSPLGPGQFTHFVPANLTWLRASLRYRQRPGRMFTALETTAEHPAHDCDARPPYPAVAWWWDL